MDARRRRGQSALLRLRRRGGVRFRHVEEGPKGPAKIGEEVFFDMKPNGADSWAGTAYNPEDGKRYTGKMTLSGDRLTTAGCVLGGLICKSYGWTRAR
jgi:uncharacterized protein (DUF2147 family)